MYTMKIILFEFLLICAIAEIFAKWSETDSDITDTENTDIPTDVDESHEEAVQDIMDILNNKKIKKEEYVGLQDLPLEKILEKSLPPVAKLKKPKKKVINNLPVYADKNIKFVQYQKGNTFKPLTESAMDNLNLGDPSKPTYPTNLPDQSQYFPSNNMVQPYIGQAENQPKPYFLPPTSNSVVKFEDIPYILSNYYNKPDVEKPQNYPAPPKTLPKFPKFGQIKQKHPQKNYIPQTKNQILENYTGPMNKIIILELYPNAGITKIIKGQTGNPNKKAMPKDQFDHIVNWQTRYNDLLKRLKDKSDAQKKSFRDGDVEMNTDGLGAPPDAGTDTGDNQDHKPFGTMVKEKSKFYFSKFKQIVQDLVSKFLNKAVKDAEEKEKARQGHYMHLRSKRDTQAGYTQDPDTCKKYNENLLKMWTTLSKYLNSTEEVDESALHNIAVMVEAYLDHHSKNSHEEPVDFVREERKKDKISEILRKIKKILGTDDATEKVKEMVLENFKPEYDDDECKQMNEDNLVSSIAISYKNYLDNAQCHGDYDTGLLRGKALLRAGPPDKKDSISSTFLDLDDNDHRTILNEDEGTKEFHRGKSPASTRSKLRSDNHREKRSIGRFYNMNKDARFKTRSGMLRRRRPKKSSKKRSRERKRHHVMRTDESCVKYANRKFLITLRTSIERFMALLDCQHDETLRSSNVRKRPVYKSHTNPYVPMMRTPSDRNYIERKFNSESELGPDEQNRLNNYVNEVKGSEDPPPVKAEEPLFVIHSINKSLRIKDIPEVTTPKPVVVHHEARTKIVGRSYPGYKSKTKYNIDSVYKSFLDSSGTRSKNGGYDSKYGLSLIKPRQKLRGADTSLYNLIKKKISNDNNSPIDAVARQSDVRNPFAEPKTNITSEDKVDTRDDHYSQGSPDGVSVNFNAMGDIINEVHNTSLSNPQVDMLSIASENEKGYVELSYLVKYPKSIIYRPQYLVKNILQYEDFVKVASQIYVTDDDRQLLKIVRYLPDNTTQTLFETQDFKSPLEIHDVVDNKKSNHLPVEEAGGIFDAHQLRQQPENETNSYPFYDNQTESNVTAPEALRENEEKEDDLDLSVKKHHNVYKFHDETDYATYIDKAMAENDTFSSTEIGRTRDESKIDLNTTAIERTLHEPESNPDSENSTELISRSDNEDAIDERIIEILNASLNSGEFVNHKDELDFDNKSVPLAKDGKKIDSGSIADYLRFKLNGDANLSSASHAYLKELESQGVSTTALTKSMLRTWWESWKNKLSTKVQSIAGRVSNLLKKLERPTSTAPPETPPTDERMKTAEAVIEAVKEV